MIRSFLLSAALHRDPAGPAKSEPHSQNFVVKLCGAALADRYRKLTRDSLDNRAVVSKLAEIWL